MNWEKISRKGARFNRWIFFLLLAWFGMIYTSTDQLGFLSYEETVILSIFGAFLSGSLVFKTWLMSERIDDLEEKLEEEGG